MTTRGYLGQVFELRPVLSAMEDRGMPIDDAARLALDVEFDAAQKIVGAELARLAPAACCRVHPKEGYKGVPPEVKAFGDETVWQEVVGKQFRESGEDGEAYRYAIREFKVAVVDPVTNEPATIQTARWCRVYEFNPNSSQQLLAYMKAKGHKVPKGKQEDEDGNPKDTTAKKELVRLARKTDDSFYLKVIEFRELTKAKGTYVNGFAPARDGCVHTAFTTDSGTGQLTSRNPNVQNFPKHGRLAKALRTMIAPPGDRVVVELDYRAFHVLTTGFCAESANWMRLARLDMHSFVAGCFLKTWKPEILEESDESLRERFEWFKSDPDRKRVRDKQAKPSDLGVGFGMGYRRLYQENLEHFSAEREAKGFWELLRAIFKEVFLWQDRVRRKAHEDKILVNAFGLPRRFYEVYRWDGKKMEWAPGDQAEEAVAFLPASIAHCHLREVMKELARRGTDERYWMGDQIHDALLFFPHAEEADACVAEVAEVMTAPSKVLRHPTLAPDGLWCDVEASVGKNWSAMKAIELERPKEATCTSR